MSIPDAIRRLQDLNPDAVRLAETVSFAAMIDRAFLRAVRLALVPPADAGAESDLWFSALVQSRTADGVVFHPEAADALRQRLTKEQVEEVWTLTRAAHGWLAPSLQLEERIAYLSVSKEPTASEDLATCLRSVLAAMVGGERAGLAQWAVRALAMFPSRVRALPEAQMIETGTRMRLGDAIAATSPDQPLPSWMPWLAPSLGTVSLELDLRDGELEIRTTTQDLPVQVPKTNPLILEVSWLDDSRKKHARQITFRDRATVPVGSRELTLRTITGEEFDLHETGQGTSRLREAIVDFSPEVQRHAEVMGRGEEIAEVLQLTERHQTIAVTGELGFGKTAFLCELIREALRREIPTVAHFFRFGDLRMESIDAAERSLSAQIAVRFGMDERVFDLRLVEVLQRLPRQASARLLIVIDDVDEARNSDRVLFGGALQEMFPFLPPGVAVIGSATWSKVVAEYVHPLRTDAPYIHEPLSFFSGNYAQAELITRLELHRAQMGVEEMSRALHLDLEVQWEMSVDAAAVALRPLPKTILNPLPYPSHEQLLDIDGEEFQILNDFTRKLVVEAIGEERTAAAHRTLVRRLGKARRIESARKGWEALAHAPDRYYLTNAVWHLVQAGEIDAARQLATSLDFMTAKIEQFGVRALITDFRMLARPEHTLLTKSVMVALGDYESEIEESPRDLAAILYTALRLAEPKFELPDLPLVPEPLMRIDTKVRSPQKHGGPIRGSRLIVDADGTQRLATWSDDGTIKLWSVAGGELIETMEAAAPVTAFGVKGSQAVATDAKGFLHVWNLYAPANSRVSVNAHDRAIDGMLIDATSNLVVTWAGTDPIRLWVLNQDGETIEISGELRGHSSAVVGCSLVAEGQLLVSVSRGGTCRLWNISSKSELDSDSLFGAVGMAFHWDASLRFILTGHRKLDVVRIGRSSLSIDSGPIETGHDLPVTGVAVSRDGRFVATWSDDQTIRLWDIPMVAAPRHVLRGHRAAITACEFHPAGPLLISADAEGVVIEWSRETGEIVSRQDRHPGAIRTIAIDHQLLFTAGDDGIVLGTGVDDFSKPKGRIEQCVVLPGDDLPVLISDGETGISSRTFEGLLPMTRPILATSGSDVLACAADASSNAYFMDGQSRLLPLPDVPDIAACAVTDHSYFAIATDAPQLFFAGPDLYWQELITDSPVTALAFAARPFLVGTAIDRTLSIWDVEHGELLYRLDAHRSRILALAALENTAVTGSADGTLRIWDLRAGSAQTIEAAHGGPITGLWMEGNIVVSASLDRTVRVFDYKLAKELAVCRGHRDRITGVAIAMTDEVLYSCSDDRTIRQWDIETGEQKAIVYGTAPFRCISWRDGKLAAGDDAGNLWTVKEGVEFETRQRVYICHSRTDLELAERLAHDLAEAGIRIELRPTSVDQFPPSRAFGGIDKADAIILIVSPASIASTGVRQEIDQAVRTNKRIIPLTSEMNRFDVTNRWPELGSFQSVRLTDWRDHESYRAAVDQLIAAIRSDRPA